jgi:hypothetical protein
MSFRKFRMKLAPLMTIGAFIAMALSGCTASQQAQFLSAQTQIANLRHADLTAAIQIANLQSPPEPLGPPCFTWFNTQLDNLQAQVSGGVTQQTVPVAGVASGIETALVASNKAVSAIQQVQGLLTPTQRAAFEVACGPLALHLIGVAGQAGLSVSSAGPLLGLLQGL